MLNLSRSLTFLFGFFILLLTFVSCTSSGSTEQEAKEPAASNDLPQLSLTTIGGKQLTIADEFDGKTILVLFQPECDDCQRQAQAIKQNLKAFENFSLYFVSSAPTAQIAAFAEHYQLNTHQHITFAQTTVQDVIQSLGQVPAPSIYIYSDEGKLIKSFNGEVGIEELGKYL